MVNIFSVWFQSLKLYLWANTEVAFNCGGKIRPSARSVYKPVKKISIEITGYDSDDATTIGKGVVINSTSEDLKNKVLEKESQESKITRLVFVDSGEPETIINDMNCLYVFTYSTSDDYNETVGLYYKYLIDPNFLTICIDKLSLSFVFSFIMISQNYDSSFSNVDLEIQSIETCWIGKIIPVVLGILCILMNLFFTKMVEKISKFDPVFTDFNIAASNIKKFKEVEKPDMGQCTICFDEFIPEDDVRILECKHYYHPTCIDRWLIGHSRRCPCCRNNIEIDEKV